MAEHHGWCDLELCRPARGGPHRGVPRFVDLATGRVGVWAEQGAEAPTVGLSYGLTIPHLSVAQAIRLRDHITAVLAELGEL